jgi:hypothetical protein
MKSFKLKAAFTYTTALLALAASSAFASIASDFNDAMSAVRAEYRARMAHCRTLGDKDRALCIKEAERNKEAAFDAAKQKRDDARMARKSNPANQ